jgi:hypothetical protein
MRPGLSVDYKEDASLTDTETRRDVSLLHSPGEDTYLSDGILRETCATVGRASRNAVGMASRRAPALLNHISAVGSMGRREQMRWVYARWVIALMGAIKLSRQETVRQREGVPMGEHVAVVKREGAIAVVVASANPNPTRSEVGTVRGDWPVFINLPPESPEVSTSPAAVSPIASIQVVVISRHISTARRTWDDHPVLSPVADRARGTTEHSAPPLDLIGSGEEAGPTAKAHPGEVFGVH